MYLTVVLIFVFWVSEEWSCRPICLHIQFHEINYLFVPIFTNRLKVKRVESLHIIILCLSIFFLANS